MNARFCHERLLLQELFSLTYFHSLPYSIYGSSPDNFVNPLTDLLPLPSQFLSRASIYAIPSPDLYTGQSSALSLGTSPGPSYIHHPFSWFLTNTFPRPIPFSSWACPYCRPRAHFLTGNRLGVSQGKGLKWDTGKVWEWASKRGLEWGIQKPLAVIRGRGFNWLGVGSGKGLAVENWKGFWERVWKWACGEELEGV
ncbi:hypothetical protein PoB_005748400 [Plakobranchus ocellatus]|uniref:Uncharacterized protein n=1 Tax=Plakobranchus ocellatus TaxID=259542 RepID=A0AAV4CEB8_9GAST|nr:hypothetical protein PoB_005748400 [Plakobranchus ocellatus]